MASEPRRVAILLAGLAAVAFVVLVLRREPEAPNYEAIRSCAKPLAAKLPQVDRRSDSTTGVAVVAVGDVDAPTSLEPWHDDRRLVVGSRSGGVYLVDPLSGETFRIVDLSDRVVLHEEGGLIGAALAPDGDHLYLHYTDQDGTSHVIELATSESSADLTTEREIISLPHPARVHHGGALSFGPDGFLFIAFGDGGGRPSDARRAGSLDDLHGKLLRIDPQPDGAEAYSVPDSNPFVAMSSARPEIWHTGMRNPYRFSFDTRTGELWIGDVGEACYEELTVVPAGTAGLDLGFPAFEGYREFLGGDAARVTFPTYAYTHERGCAVIAGTVSADPRLPQLEGRFLFGDFCRPGLSWVNVADGGVEVGEVDVELAGIQSFGVGPAGETYVLTVDGVHRLDPAS